MKLQLIDLLRQYDGGITAMAERLGRPRSTLYKFAHADMVSPPWDLIRQTALLFKGKTVLGLRGKVTPEKVLDLWQQAKAVRS